MRTLRTLLAPLFLFALLLSGCLSAGKLGGVLVHVTAVAPSSSKELYATLSFTNENVVSIGVTKAKYTLMLNGTTVARCETEKAVGLPQLNKVTQTIPFVITNPALLRTQAEGSGHANYTLKSVLEIMSGEDKLVIDSVESGTLNLSALAGKIED